MPAADGFSRSGIDMQWIPLPSIVASDFDTLATGFDNFTEPLNRSVREVMAPSIAKNFSVGGRPAWAGLTESTVSRKAKKGYGSKILIASGALADKGSSPSIWTVNRNEAKIDGLPGSIFYGLYHQTGFQPRGTGGDIFADLSRTPAREWAVIQRDDANNIEEIFFDWIEKKAAAAGFG